MRPVQINSPDKVHRIRDLNSSSGIVVEAPHILLGTTVSKGRLDMTKARAAKLARREEAASKGITYAQTEAKTGDKVLPDASKFEGVLLAIKALGSGDYGTSIDDLDERTFEVEKTSMSHTVVMQFQDAGPGEAWIFPHVVTKDGKKIWAIDCGYYQNYDESNRGSIEFEFDRDDFDGKKMDVRDYLTPADMSRVSDLFESVCSVVVKLKNNGWTFSEANFQFDDHFVPKPSKS